jgi:Lon protease-like protein
MTVLPMFPLGTVLFPYALLPLHVFEPRYRTMMQHVLHGDQEFGVVLIERGSEVGGGDTRFHVGTIARIAQVAELPDGRYALTTVGTRRLRVTRWLPDDPYPRAEIEVLTDAPARGELEDARARVEIALETVTDLARRIEPRMPVVPALDADPVRASYEASALAPLGPLDAQRVLEADDTGQRLALLASLLDERAEELRALLG